MSDLPRKTTVSRRLAAILAADIAGYSALMGADEEATVAELKAHQVVVLPMINEYGAASSIPLVMEFSPSLVAC